MKKHIFSNILRGGIVVSCTLALCLNVASTKDFNTQKPIISVSIAPIGYFVEQIAKNTADINLIIPPNSDEHTLDFKPSVVANLQKSAVYFTIGLEIEAILADKFKGVKIVDISKGVAKINDTHEHNHGDSHEHDLHAHNSHSHGDSHAHDSHSHELESHEHSHDSHSRKDPHIWLDPILAKTLSQNIANTLRELYPQNAKFYAKNLADFEAKLDSLHAQITQILSKSKHKKFIIYHPSLSYFAKRYNLTQIPVEIKSKEPKARDLQAIITRAKKEQIRTIFVQAGFSQKSAKTLAKELGANVAQINHLSDEWDKQMLNIARQIAEQ
ncbi:metal ABC transporter solute-binding protein, Zn/Mn family [Helicobacter sp. T3_23-1056]